MRMDTGWQLELCSRWNGVDPMLPSEKLDVEEGGGYWTDGPAIRALLRMECCHFWD